MEDHIGVPIKRAAEIIGVSRPRLIYWGKAGILVPKATIDIGAQHRWLYSIDELAAGRIIRRIEGAEVDIRHLTWLVGQYRNEDHPQPLLSYKWAIEADAHRVFLSDDDGASWMDGDRTYQYVIATILDLEEIRAEVRREATRRRGTPGLIVRNRGKLGNKRVLEGTRVPVDGVKAWLKVGAPDDRILEAFPAIEAADIDAVRREMQQAG